MFPPQRLRNLLLLSALSLTSLQAHAVDKHAVKNHNNGLRSLALSRPARSNAIIALQFNAGSFQDTVPGLAHLAEHVFLRQHILDARRERIPLRDFLALHGGRVNAKTSHESTYFLFEIQRDAAPVLLRELANLLREPSLNTTLIASEISAVDDEFGLLKTRQSWLLQDALKAATASSHPFRQNSAGNRNSFAPYSLEDIQAALYDFFKRYYRPANLSLIYVSPEDSAQQHTSINNSFGSLPVRPAADTSEAPLFDPDTLPRRLQICLLYTSDAADE